MNILFLTNDLMFTSRVSGVASQLGHTLQVAATPTGLLEKQSALDEPSLVILDMNMSQIHPAELVPQLRSSPVPPAAILAYGPHVQETRLEEATAASCEEVFTRGQFNGQLAAIMSKWTKIDG